MIFQISIFYLSYCVVTKFVNLSEALGSCQLLQTYNNQILWKIWIKIPSIGSSNMIIVQPYLQIQVEYTKEFFFNFLKIETTGFKDAVSTFAKLKKLLTTKYFLFLTAHNIYHFSGWFYFLYTLDFINQYEPLHSIELKIQFPIFDRYHKINLCQTKITSILQQKI